MKNKQEKKVFNEILSMWLGWMHLMRDLRFFLYFSIPPTRNFCLGINFKVRKMWIFPALLSRMSRGRSDENQKNRSPRSGGIFCHFCMKTFRYIWVNKSLNFQFSDSIHFSHFQFRSEDDQRWYPRPFRRESTFLKVCEDFSEFFLIILKKCNVTISWCLKMKHFSRSFSAQNFFFLLTVLRYAKVFIFLTQLSTSNVKLPRTVRSWKRRDEKRFKKLQ